MAALAGAALLLVGVGAIIISTAFQQRTAARIVAADAPIDAGAYDPADIDSNNSPALVRNPVRPANLAIANRIDTPRYACALHVSSDGGASWTRTPLPRPPREQRTCFAPDLAFGRDGTLYVSFVTLRGRGNVPHAVWTARSTDGGRTLSAPVKALGQLAFQTRLTADRTAAGRLYLTWLQSDEIGFLRFAHPGNPIMSARSDDGGRTWRAPVRVSNPARGRAIAPSPATGPRGELYVLYLDLAGDRLDYEGAHNGEGGKPYGGRFRLVLARSIDGGATWGESVADSAIAPIDRFVVFYPAYPLIAVDQHGGRVYAAYHDARLGDADVSLWSLPGDGGTSWRGPVRVNDTRRRDATAQYMPRVAVAPNGRVDVEYYDRRGDRANVSNSVSMQSSDDAGQTFGPALTLSSTRFDSRIGFGSAHGLPDLGSRLGLVSDDRRALAVWTDTRAGTRATNKQDLARALIAFSQPARLSATATSALRYGGAALVLVGLAALIRRRLPRMPQGGYTP